jgi:hypothetical protein
MRKLSTPKALILLVLPGVAVHALSKEPCKNIVQDDGARKIAYAFLMDRDLRHEYQHPAVSTVKEGCNWKVTLARKEPDASGESEAVVLIDRESGEASWAPE